jgi:glucans biosynthesis protein
MAAQPAPLKAIGLGPPQSFSFEGLKLRARALARSAYAPPIVRDADALQAIDYDAYGQMVFRPELQLWNGVPGAQTVRLFPLGRYFKEPVAIHVLNSGVARPLLFNPNIFETPADHPLRRLKAGGFAGFRLMNPGADSDWMAFLGASYFRAASPFNQYGASARGLAINSGGPAPEEFPRFSAFWLEQAGQGGLTVYALLEGPSVTGAFRIDNQGGASGAVQTIEAELNFRAAVQTLGVAPLTSMFWYGQNSTAPRRDWRPQVHDSDGLAIWTGAGERIWRPLNDPKTVAGSSFIDNSPKGFGLIQRDRDFADYQDDSVFYEKRPSLWVEPLAPFGKGEVRLVELPTADETNDNIVSFWTPAQKVQPGSVIDARYRLHWTTDAPTEGDIGRIVATRVGEGGRPGQPARPDATKFVIDVEGQILDGLTRSSGVTAAVTASAGTIDGVAAYPVVGTKLWRMTFDLSGANGRTVDLRADLRRGGKALSETWLYQARP